MTLNVELLDRAIEFARKSKEVDGPLLVQVDGNGEVWLEWDQTTWYNDRALTLPESEEFEEVCGTACCIAGWVGIATGVEREEGVGDSFKVNGKWVSAERYAMQALGLTEHQAAVMFKPENGLADLEEFAELVKAGDELLGYPEE